MSWSASLLKEGTPRRRCAGSSLVSALELEYDSSTSVSYNTGVAYFSSCCCKIDGHDAANVARGKHSPGPKFRQTSAPTFHSLRLPSTTLVPVHRPLVPKHLKRTSNTLPTAPPRSYLEVPDRTSPCPSFGADAQCARVARQMESWRSTSRSLSVSQTTLPGTEKLGHILDAGSALKPLL